MILAQCLFLFQCLASSRPSCWPELYVSSNLPVFISNTYWLWLTGYLNMSLAAGKLNVFTKRPQTLPVQRFTGNWTLAYNEFLSINIYINMVLQTTLWLIFLDVDTSTSSSSSSLWRTQPTAPPAEIQEGHAKTRLYVPEPSTQTHIQMFKIQCLFFISLWKSFIYTGLNSVNVILFLPGFRQP